MLLYRRREYNGQQSRPLLVHEADMARSSMPPIKPVVYQVHTTPGSAKVHRQHSKAQRVPQQHTNYNQSQKLSSSGAPRPQYVKRQYNTHPNSGVRIAKLPYRPVHMQYNRPVVFHQDPIKPMIARIEVPNTVPHVRLASYKPKVVPEYFSPYNIRHYANDQSLESSFPDSSYSTDVGSNLDGT